MCNGDYKLRHVGMKVGNPRRRTARRLGEVGSWGSCPRAEQESRFELGLALCGLGC